MSEQRRSCDCGCMGAGPALTSLLNNLGPKAAREHFLTARVEFLKGVRALIDARIEHLSRREQTGTSVPVE